MLKALHFKERIREKEINMSFLITILIIAAVISLIVAAGLGPVSVSSSDTFKILLSQIPGMDEWISPTWQVL